MLGKREQDHQKRMQTIQSFSNIQLWRGPLNFVRKLNQIRSWTNLLYWMTRKEREKEKNIIYN